MDSLFIMQRYWGSDEEEDNEENISLSVVAEENYGIHKKKKVNSSVIENGSNSSVKQTFNNEVIAEDIVDLTQTVVDKKRNSLKKGKKFKSQINNQDNPSLIENCSNVSVKGAFKEDSSDCTEAISEDTVELTKAVVDEKKTSFKKGKKCKSEIKNQESPSLAENCKNSFAGGTFNNEDSSNCNVVKGEDTVNLTKTVGDEKKNLLKKGRKCKSEIKNEEIATEVKNELDSLSVKSASENFCTIGHVQHEKDVKVKHALPYWLTNPTYIGINLLEEETPVSDLPYLDSNSKNNLRESGINFLFPVQLAVIPWLMQSKEQSLLIRPSDICVSAPTGSGKTLAFVLPIVQSLKDRVVCAIRALVVLPVSELAIQVYKVFETFVRGTDLKVALLTGQKSFAAEQNALIKSNGQRCQSLVDIVVTTPGRIYDHIYRTKGFCLKRLRYLVIDEADRMLEEIQQGWLKKVEDAVFNSCNFPNCVCSSIHRVSHEPSSAFNFGFISQPLQKLLYSATLTHDPEQLHSLSLYKPKLFTASSTSSDDNLETCAIPPGLRMLRIICDNNVKPMVICQLIKHHNFKRVLCFTETVERAHRLHLVLEEMGFLQVREISSFNRVVQRKIVLEQFSSGKVDILVCSDLVARGIDIENIDCVISYDVPQSIKSYIHRIGRTARAGKTGTAVTLLTDGEIPHFKKILKSAGIEMPEKVNITSEDLKAFVKSYQTALMKADAKLKNEKSQLPSRTLKNIKRKRE